MGIKGIYREIGAGKRVSLCKLAVETLEEKGRPFRLAIDISIWQFQVQAAKGGANPAIRTLFYRLVRLLGLAIEPVLVFDGPKKPAFKRNKRTGRGDTVATAMAKRLIKLFGFQIHDAPGEAEAECALLQQQGVVDAVLSEDVDTIMFGCTRTLRNWSSDGTKGSKAPTHVSLYDSKDLGQSESGLDREGMVLVALMSGGDYLPEGIPGCGVKVACEAAKAGFGKSLCRLKRADTTAVAAWKDNLSHELRTNESGFFRTKHKALTIPESFPNLEILRYYTHPVVSQPSAVDRVKEQFRSAKPSVDVLGLRAFVGETFDWNNKIGAVKLIRVIAPSLLVQALLALQTSQESRLDEPQGSQEEGEAKLIRAISSRRSHFSTDATPELRISYVPADIVALDLSQEEEAPVVSYARAGLALNSDDDFEEEIEESAGVASASSTTKKAFDPLQPDSAWIPESVVKLGAPLTVEGWEEKQRSKQLARTAKAPKRRMKKPDMAAGALDRWVHVTKNVTTPKKNSPVPLVYAPPRSRSRTASPVASPRPANTIQLRARSVNEPSKKPPTALRSKKAKPKGQAAAASKPAAQTKNPWTIAGSQASPRVSKSFRSAEPIIISSSPAPAASSPPCSSLKHVRMPPAENSFVQDPFASPSLSARKQRPPGSRQTRHGEPAASTRRGGSSPAGSPQDDALPSSQVSVENHRSTRPESGRTRPDGTGSPKTRALAKSKPGVEYQTIDLDSDSDVFRDLASIRLRKKGARKDDDLKGSKVADEHNGEGQPKDQQKDIPPKSKTTTTKLYVPRVSDIGFVREVEVTREEADRLVRQQLVSATARDSRKGGRIWRQSEVSVLDLTAED
ncbi:Flap structure-specific endonuclease [Pleurostoma richardsiae]|uniref:Flap structure-specific endonuclease n=1 Tax=Pleurostoma richardsiae TaxID=41990 RepID=A0AA38RKA2_9PEZI|nr:Flap structure-specific endonuclease [Pleurostoma richardsiae]